MVGLGPIEPLLKDDSITDILINGPFQVYVERRGELELTAVRFRDNDHLLRIVNRIVAGVGRRIDESSADGRRPPARRQPGQRRHPADRHRRRGGLDPQVLQEAAARSSSWSSSGPCRQCVAEFLHGAIRGAGLHRDLRRHRLGQDHPAERPVGRRSATKERLITIEDAAELQLQQPHVVRMETRPPNIEGKGEIRQRELVKNALRMRPDRVILGEVRGEEAFDMLQAMNTGHEGSMATIHANNPRDAITRLEQMVAMGGMNARPGSRCAARSPRPSA